MRPSRCIVHIGRDTKKPVSLLRHVYRPHGKWKDEVVSSDRVVAVINGLDAGCPVRNPRTDLHALLANHHGRGRTHRHVVLSLEDTYGARNRKRAFLALAKLARLYCRQFARDCQWIGVIHQDRRHPHLHLVIANSDGTRCLDWGRDMLKAMQEITSWAHGVDVVSGKGSGLVRSSPGRSPYTLPKRGRVNDLATLLFQEPDGFGEAVKQGIIRPARKNRAGKVTSLEWQGKRYRVSTLLRVAQGMGLSPLLKLMPPAPSPSVSLPAL